MTGALSLLRPFAWLALISFLVGFASYLALGEPEQTLAREEIVQPVAASGPTSEDWEVARHI